MLRFLFMAVFLVLSVCSFGQLDSTRSVERAIIQGDDDADQFGPYVSLSDFSLDAGSSFGERSYFAVRFRNLQLESGFQALDTRIRFVVQSDTIERVVLKIQLESKIAPRDYVQEDFDITTRQTGTEIVYWVLKNVGEGDTIFTPDLSILLEELMSDQFATRFVDLSFIFGPDFAIDSTGSTELEVYSTNQIDQGRSPRFFMTFDTLYGIKEPRLQDFSVYPNPATDRVLIESTSARLTKIELIHLTGQVAATVVPAAPQHPTTIETAGLARGSYILRIESDKGIGVRQVILQ